MPLKMRLFLNCPKTITLLLNDFAAIAQKVISWILEDVGWTASDLANRTLLLPKALQ